MSRIVRRSLVASAFVLGPLALSACPNPVTQHDEYEPLCGEVHPGYGEIQIPAVRNVEILFVIDNSGSMAEEQVKLVEAAGVLFDQLDAVDANYRVAFTTTDVGNPLCPATTPESGSLVLSSCETRLDEFLFDNGTVDVRDFACSDACSLDAAALAIQPSSIDLDTSSKPRPWIERIEGVTNLPATTDPVEAFKCFAPQGIAGCGFESPLEAMYLALHRTDDSDDDNFGFRRADGLLAVVLLTDETDCSSNEQWAEIFSADGNRVFWSDPAAASASSAVCWNAGVTCTGDPSQYDSCEPANKDVDGDETESFVDTVLYPMVRYTDLLDDLERQQQDFVAWHELVLTVIAGVQGNGADWSVAYAQADDPSYQLEYGIGPGCTSMAGDMAVPPVRLLALAQALDPAGPTEPGPLGLHSVCDADYSTAMAGLGERLTSQFRPLCHYSCAADAELSTPQLEPNCVVEQTVPGEQDPQLMLECSRAADGTYLIDAETATYQLPASANVCYVTLVDPDGSETQDPSDDLSEACSDGGFNLEFVIVRRRGVPAPGGTWVGGSCERSACPAEDCPGIGG